MRPYRQANRLVATSKQKLKPQIDRVRIEHRLAERRHGSGDAEAAAAEDRLDVHDPVDLVAGADDVVHREERVTDVEAEVFGEAEAELDADFAAVGIAVALPVTVVGRHGEQALFRRQRKREGRRFVFDWADAPAAERFPAVQADRNRVPV